MTLGLYLEVQSIETACHGFTATAQAQIATTGETMAAENWRYLDFPGELSEQCALQVRLYVPVLLGAGQGELSKECWSRSKLF